MRQRTKLEMHNGESAIFGYGSLLLKSQIELTLGGEYEGPLAPCTLDGWVRIWNSIMPNKNFYTDLSPHRLFPQNIIYLNIQPKAGSVLNGVLFTVHPEQLAAFDKREWIYNRQTITRYLGGVEIIGGEAFAYVGKPESILRSAADLSYAAIRRSYLEIIEEGLHDWGPDFRKQYENSTQAIPMDLVMDDQKSEEQAIHLPGSW